MGVENLDIILDNPSGIFFSGQVVSGAVKIHITNEPKRARGLKIKIKGESDVRWEERTSHTEHEESRVETYWSHEIYLDQKVYLIGDGHGDIDILPGFHSYPFSFQLPPNAPSSFESYYGTIRYKLKAAIDVAWAIDPDVTVFFSVVQLLDLNSMPHLAQPAEYTDSKKLGCCCFSSGNVSSTARIGKRGFVPGEGIPLSADVANESSKKLDGTKWNLRQTVTYYAPGGFKSETKTVAWIEHSGKTGEGQNDTWENEFLTVPPLPPSNVTVPNGCENIKIRYTIVFEVDIPWAWDPSLPFDIEIGSVPFRQNTQDQSWIRPPPDEAPPHPVQGWNTNFPDIPPPAFNAATLDHDPRAFVDDSDDEGDQNRLRRVNSDFRPVYPTFNYA